MHIIFSAPNLAVNEDIDLTNKLAGKTAKDEFDSFEPNVQRTET